MCIRDRCASPLNARYRRFCSAYLDVDEVFGSIGDALRFEPDAGSFEVNPPFDPVFMGAICGHMERLLANAAGAMSFAVIVPSKPNDASWSRLVNSVYARERIEFKAGSHAYVAGGQHVRSARATPSAAATTLVLLQNESGARKWPATREAIAAVRAGFAEGTKRSGDDDGHDDDDDGHDAAGEESGGDGNGSGDSDATDDDGFDARGSRRRAAGSGGGGAIWDFGDVRRLFWGAGSAGRWGKRPAGWVVENVAECIEDHWVGDDPEDGEDEEGDEEDDDDEGGDGDEDVSGSDSGDEDDDEDEDDDDEEDEDDEDD